MADKTIPVEEISQLEISSTGGSLYLSGWSRDEIRIRDFSDENALKKTKTKLKLSFQSDGLISIPHQLSVSVGTIARDGIVKGIEGSLKISTVGGDLTLSDVQKSTAESVGGDVFAKRLQDDLLIKKVGNDCLIEDLQGQLSLEQVGGDIQINRVAGGIAVQAGGDGQINFSPVPWQAYQVNTAGDLSIGLPDDCNAEFSLKSGSSDITIKLGNIDEKIDQPEIKKVIGEGGAVIMLTAGGKLHLSSDKYSWFSGMDISVDELEDLAADFSSQTVGQIKNHLGNLEVDLRESLSGLSESLDSLGLSDENLKELKDQLEESSRLAVQKAEAAAVKASARIEKNIAKAQRKARKLKRKSSEFDLSKFLSDQVEEQEVSEKERLLILEMLQEKKISPDEADELLKALEGKDQS
jgi:hypothetical protein